DDWWPWKNKEVSMPHVMGAFPRSVFSENELKATNWFASKLGINGLPSVKQVKNHREQILNVAGLASEMHEGELGSFYVVNSWAKIFQHEFANPQVRPHISVYAEHSGPKMGEARQAERWRDEVDGLLAGPMARDSSGRDYFVNEICFANIDSLGTATAVLPVRWYEKDGALWAQVHRVLLTSDGDAFVIDARDGGHMDLPLTAFFLSVVELLDPVTQRRYGIPSPNNLRGQRTGILRTDDPRTPPDPWDQPAVNPWREIAKGRRVYSLPLWLYCDDTSGNISKKWNKHNSILFTLAGLPRKYTQMLYNIHFGCTSNLASPLEMMEAFEQMLEEARKEGIEVWDSKLDELVLLIPWILAFQGDNPMSSEFASHVGMGGKCFCRICHVRGPDAAHRPPGDAGEIERLDDFMKAGKLRSKSETVSDLNDQLKRALNGAPSGIDAMATETGSKDKYFHHFVEKFQDVASKVKEKLVGQTTTGMSKADLVKDTLEKFRDQLPDNVFNPVLKISDFDPNQDTPFEILHCLLLGVVKYWWRDAVSRQNTKGKDELKTRLSSVDVAGLETSRLRGNTFVQYAGSLVGRDFRIILQVAPIVLRGMIPESHYEGWLALCRLAPLMYQPEIEDLPAYMQKLKEAVADFLAATALWNIAWFNKPKFHLFESYNLVIRLRSIHSPRTAPGKDIAVSFSHMHAVRHLISGGFVLHDIDGVPLPAPRQAGREVCALLEDPEFIRLMSMEGLVDKSRSGESNFSCRRTLSSYTHIGYYSPLKSDSLCFWSVTEAHKAGIPCMSRSGKVLRCQKLVLQNEDHASLHKYVLYHSPSVHGPLVGRIEEILVDPEQQRLIGVLVSKCVIGAAVLPYRFPSCTTTSSTERALIAFEDILCAVNTFHNCAAHGCTVTRTRIAVQERQQTAHKEDEIVHATCPDDQLLNLAQLRSATYIQYFQPDAQYPNLPRAAMIEAAIQNKKNLDRENQKAKDDRERRKNEKGKGKGKRTRKRNVDKEFEVDREGQSASQRRRLSPLIDGPDTQVAAGKQI
ncbi:hypothetical protein PLICRDRAFT_98567, partial [Plicaturopsis crispa FD-325 SS-3]